MIFALSRSLVLSALVMLVVAICVGLLGYGYVANPHGLLEWASKITLLISVTLVLLGIRPVFRALHWVSFAKYWWFPWLDGEWRAEIRSNWPKVERMYSAAKREIPKFDSLAGPLTSDDELVTTASVTIETGLFDISIEITPHGTDKTSRTRFVRPRWSKPDRPELSYVYEQTDPTHLVPTDTRQHFGAGIVEYIAKTDELTGHYWTNRNAEAALNTAGTIIMRRVVAAGFMARILKRYK
ncbi:hypothetical protein FY134_26010 (plasmid) [Agrobacterium fabrum]|uniref:hypothetical protein n=1 Tax=Agrobacterium fabrum TaxID=1176649 RepID=UPI0021CF1E8F|nr:hypothetical protein [Agrobacterium fabrum]UXT61158.1 hypothetical protein FY134_26010 [Agrobacterium fabrum]